MSLTSRSPLAAQPAAVGKVSVAAPMRPRISSDAAAPSSVGTKRAYERFLEMPVALVLGVLWLAGAALVGSCALLLYLALTALL